MQLTDYEKQMRDGDHGAAKARAMDLLIRYGEALGAERLVETNNVAGTWAVANPILKDFAKSMDAVFSEFNLDSDEIVETPAVETYSVQLIQGIDPASPEMRANTGDAAESQQAGEKYFGKRGVAMMSTCTPYQVGNVPVFGEHCAWMESSAVVYCNGVLGARTNTEGRESTGAASITRRIPYWGYHLPENRLGTHLVDVEVEIDDIMDWGMLGYWLGYEVEEDIPVVAGRHRKPNQIKLKHFGAAAASSGGVEMFHVPGTTPEARTMEEAFGPRKPVATLRYGDRERRDTFELLNSNASDTQLDFVMLGCPHNSLEQMVRIVRALEGRTISANSALWVFTPRALKLVSDANGYTEIIEKAGGRVYVDTCPAISRQMPKGTKVVAVDSAKQAHYLPAITGAQCWFGTVEECVDGAVTGQWRGRLS
jgi:predicted aconitase